MDRAIVSIEIPGGEAYEFRLSRASFTVGRSAGCDLALPSAAISGVHAQFEVAPESGEAWVTDLGSKNGTFVDGIRIGPNGAIPIAPETAVRIANIVLRVRAIRPGERSDSISAENSQSVSRPLLRGMLGEAVRQNRALLEVLKGPAKGARLSIEESCQRVALGTGEGAQLDLLEPSLAGKPILLLCTGHAYHLVPSAAAPVRVGRRAVSQPVRLRSGDELRVGKSLIQFTDPLQWAIDELEGLERGEDPETRQLPPTADAEAAPGDARGAGGSPRRTAAARPATRRAWSPLERFVLGFAVASLLVALVFLLAVLGLLPT